MKVDCWLCQPAGTPILTQIGCRLGVTFVVDVKPDVREPIERPSVQVKVAMLPPVLRLTVPVLTDTSKFPDVESAYTPLNTLFYDVLGEAVEEVGAAL